MTPQELTRKNIPMQTVTKPCAGGYPGRLALAGIFALGFTLQAAAGDCPGLANTTLPTGKITAAALVPAGGFTPPVAGPFGGAPGGTANPYANLPEFCRVSATLAPTADSDIKIEVWLPAGDWNGKFVGIGNGVWAGQISHFQMGDPLTRGYAVASTDTGHAGNGMTVDFAVGHPEKLADFGYRAVHEMTVAAKQLITAFYGSAPGKSLWNSCSTGGRQGLMAAYRYPEDYDAISAMAPANPMTDLMTQSVWTGYQALRSPEAALPREKLAAVHAAFIAQCDAKDGVADKLVSRPESCAFDPAVAACQAGDGPDCLTSAQVETMRAIYRGVRDAKTDAALLPGFPPGSEMQLALLLGGPEPFPAATGYMRLLVFADPAWDFSGFDYGRDTLRAREFGQAVLDVPGDGLAPFFARGGRLLLSHGWNDGLIPANNTLAFYRGLRESLPREQLESSVRLFMIPGMDHCAGGEGPFLFDTLGLIDAWAQDGKAPEQVIVSRPPGAPAMTRPICAYPQVAQFSGNGSADDAANFRCTAPEK